MGLFDRFFGNGSEEQVQPKIKFGRYSDSYKSPASYKAWDEALEQFEAKDYLASYRAFFVYLRDEQEDNVRLKETEEGIHFDLFQGSKKISGFVDQKKLKVESKVAHTEKFRVAFMRRLMELNYALEYSRFALDREGNITIVFDTYTIDGSPYKLYYALKEVATKADKQDDLLLDEFKSLKPVDVDHLEFLPDEEKKIKCDFIQEQIRQTLEEVDHGKLNKDKYAGGVAYLLLHLIYKLDYLVKPEGFMMEVLERLHRLYSTKDDKKSMAELNQVICKELRFLLDRPREEFYKEMYRVPATFGITMPVSHDRVVSLIDSELHQMDWYLDNGYDEIALAIPGFICSYCLFIYAIPKPGRKLFHLYLQTTESDYFRALGFTDYYYDTSTGTLDKKAIKRAIRKIVDDHRDRFSKLVFPTNTLDFSTPARFARSYFQVIRNLDMTKAD